MKLLCGCCVVLTFVLLIVNVFILNAPKLRSCSRLCLLWICVWVWEPWRRNDGIRRWIRSCRTGKPRCEMQGSPLSSLNSYCHFLMVTFHWRDWCIRTNGKNNENKNNNKHFHSPIMNLSHQFYTAQNLSHVPKTFNLYHMSSVRLYET